MASVLRSSLRWRALTPRISATTIAARPITTTSHTSSATAAAAASGSDSSSNQPYFPNEPSGPHVQTAIPGPKSQKAIKNLDRVFDTRSLNMLANYEKSLGN